jgi:hypothetical protein
VNFIRLRRGSLLLVYDDRMSRSIPLSAALSLDGGRTYPCKRNIVEGDKSYAARA